jgi:hypothetical protein
LREEREGRMGGEEGSERGSVINELDPATPGPSSPLLSIVSTSLVPTPPGFETDKGKRKGLGKNHSVRESLREWQLGRGADSRVRRYGHFHFVFILHFSVVGLNRKQDVVRPRWVDLSAVQAT